MQDGSLSIEPDIDSGKTSYGVPNMWITPQRVIACQEKKGGGKQYLGKWEGLGYDEATWENPSDLAGFRDRISAFEKRLPLAKQSKVGGLGQPKCVVGSD